MAGSKTSYTKKKGETICGYVAQGLPLTEACKKAKVNYNTANRWKWKDSPQFQRDFADSLARAWKDHATATLWEIARIEQGILDGEIEPRQGEKVIKSMQWRCEKMNRQLFGEKIDINTTSKEIKVLDVTERAAKLASIMARADGNNETPKKKLETPPNVIDISPNSE